MLEVDKIREKFLELFENKELLTRLNERAEGPIKFHDFATHAAVDSDAMGETFVVEFVAPNLIEKFGYISARKVISNPNKQTTEIIQKQLAIELALKPPHPNVLETFDFNILNRGFHIFRDFMDFGDLRKLLLHEKKLDDRISGYVICKTLLGLEYLHKNDITHGYLSPENIMLSITGDLKIANYSGCHTNKELMKAMNLPETPDTYRAPEFEKGPLNNKVDVWSLGIIAAEVITGEVIYVNEFDWVKDEISEDILPKIIGKKINNKPIAELTADKQEFIKMCLEENPARRATVAQLLESTYFKSHCGIPRELINNFILRVVYQRLKQRKRSQ